MQKHFVTLALASLLALTANAQTTLQVAQRDVDTDQFGATFRSHLIEAHWEDGLGCPTNARTFLFNPATGGGTNSTYTDPACPTGDAKGDSNEFGLILSKLGPTQNLAAAVGEVLNEPGKFVKELGYDLRRGSHCGAGAPRFNVTLQDGEFFFVGCASPPPTTAIAGQGWTRMRWGDKAAGIPVPAFDRNAI